MTEGFVVLDYRGRQDHSILEELRELLLTRRTDVTRVEALVDSEKFARKIALFAEVTSCHTRLENRGSHWSVIITPPSCPFRAAP